jgi:hypothetical protein
MTYHQVSYFVKSEILTIPPFTDHDQHLGASVTLVTKPFSIGHQVMRVNQTN